MKKFLSISLMAIAAVTSAHAATPSHISRDANGGYNVTYSYTDKAKTGWYVGARAELSFLNWKNKYTESGLGIDASYPYSDDSFTLQSMFGASLVGGRRIGYFWRAELEAGYIGYFEDKDLGTEFSMSIPYATLNGYYDFSNGLYVGAGVGAAAVMSKVDIFQGDIATTGGQDHTNFTPMGALMLGFAHRLDDNLVLDLRYRLAGFSGGTHTVEINNGFANFETKIGFVWDNSISVGLRYEF